MTESTAVATRSARPARGRLTESAARDLTDQIRSGLHDIHLLVTEAHERKAHEALGYPNWDSYVRAEFQMSPARSYQHLDTGKVVKAIEKVMADAGELQEEVPLPTARDVQKAKGQLPTLRKRFKDLLKDGELEPADALRAAIRSLPTPPRRSAQPAITANGSDHTIVDAELVETETDSVVVVEQIERAPGELSWVDARDADQHLPGEDGDDLDLRGSLAKELQHFRAPRPDMPVGAVTCHTCNGRGYIDMTGGKAEPPFST